MKNQAEIFELIRLTDEHDTEKCVFANCLKCKKIKKIRKETLSENSQHRYFAVNLKNGHVRYFTSAIKLCNFFKIQKHTMHKWLRDGNAREGYVIDYKDWLFDK